jgi:PAS domain S-box-containing protein
MTDKPPPPATASRAGYVLGLVFLLLAAGIISSGYIYYHNYRRNFRAETEQRLMSISDLKVHELEYYRRECMADASIFKDNPSFARLVQRFFEQPAAAADAQRQLQDWLDKFSHLGDFDLARLLDAQGVNRLAAPGGLKPVTSSVMRAASEVLRTGRTVFLDFYRDDDDDDHLTYLALLVPIDDPADAGRRLGVLVLRIDPITYLYPFIQGWPTPSKSAESLLVSRDGNQTTYLNELRFKAHIAPTPRLPLAGKKHMPTLEDLENEGIMEVLDYRNVPVIATLRAIPDSPWFMVTKVDSAEVYKPVHERLWLVVAMFGVMIFGTGALIRLIWQYQQGWYFREQVAAAKTLHQAQTTLQVAMDHSPVGIAIADAPDGTLRYVNDAGLMIRGGERDAIINGIGIDQYVASWHLLDFEGKPLAAEEVPLTRAIRFGETCSREFIIRRDGGEDRLVLAKAAPILDDQGKVVAGIVAFMDLTERKVMEEQLRLTLSDLQRSNRELEQFAYVASHDLQEPLRMVASFTQLLAQRYEDQLDAKAKKYISYAVDGAIRMQTLINDLLAFSRVGVQNLTRESVDTRAALDEARRNLSGLIEEKQAVITHGELPVLDGNHSQLVMLFQNLISNAIKFHAAGPPQVHVSAQDSGYHWLFAIKDNGIGIDPQHAARVFVIFQRLHTREQYPGTGIGLAICKRIVERHGGKIWFESTPGHGTTFFFTLPKQSRY